MVLRAVSTARRKRSSVFAPLHTGIQRNHSSPCIRITPGLPSCSLWALSSAGVGAPLACPCKRACVFSLARPCIRIAPTLPPSCSRVGTLCAQRRVPRSARPCTGLQHSLALSLHSPSVHHTKASPRDSHPSFTSRSFSLDLAPTPPSPPALPSFTSRPSFLHFAPFLDLYLMSHPAPTRSTVTWRTSAPAACTQSSSG